MKRPEIYACIIVTPDHIVFLDLSHKVTIRKYGHSLIASDSFSNSLSVSSDAQGGGGVTKTVEIAGQNCR